MKRIAFIATMTIAWGFIIHTLWKNHVECKAINEQTERAIAESERLVEQAELDIQEMIRLNNALDNILCSIRSDPVIKQYLDSINQ